jgi:hypothetical protein
LLLFRDEAFEGDSRGLLLGLFLGGSFGLGEGPMTSLAVGDSNLDAEELLVVGAALRGEDVLGLAGSGGLEVLLECGLVVADGSGEGVSRREGSMEVGDGGLDDVALDEGAGGFETAVDVQSGYDGFEGVGEESGLLAATALFFAAAEAEHGTEADALGDAAEVTAADEGGAEAGEFALAGVGEAAIEAFRYGEAEDGVADEL